MGIIEVDRDTRISEVLVIGNRVHLFVIARTHHIAVVCIQILAHGHVVFFREAVSGKGDATVEFVEIFGIAQAERITVQRLFIVGCVVIQADMRVGDVKCQRAQN